MRNPGWWLVVQGVPDGGLELFEAGPGDGERVLLPVAAIEELQREGPAEAGRVQVAEQRAEGATPSPGYTRSASVMVSRGGWAG